MFRWYRQAGDVDARQCLRLHLEINLCVDIGRIHRDMAEPRADRVDVNACSEKVNRGCMPQRVRTDALAAHRLDLIGGGLCA